MCVQCKGTYRTRQRKDADEISSRIINGVILRN